MIRVVCVSVRILVALLQPSLDFQTCSVWKYFFINCLGQYQGKPGDFVFMNPVYGCRCGFSCDCRADGE